MPKILIDNNQINIDKNKILEKVIKFAKDIQQIQADQLEDMKIQLFDLIKIHTDLQNHEKYYSSFSNLLNATHKLAEHFIHFYPDTAYQTLTNLYDHFIGYYPRLKMLTYETEFHWKALKVQFAFAVGKQFSTLQTIEAYKSAYAWYLQAWFGCENYFLYNHAIIEQDHYWQKLESSLQYLRFTQTEAYIKLRFSTSDNEETFNFCINHVYPLLNDLKMSSAAKEANIITKHIETFLQSYYVTRIAEKDNTVISHLEKHLPLFAKHQQKTFLTTIRQLHQQYFTDITSAHERENLFENYLKQTQIPHSPHSTEENFWYQLRKKYYVLLHSHSDLNPSSYFALVRDELIQPLVEKIIQELDEPPCEFSLFALGSAARNDFCILSDFDCLLLIDKNSADTASNAELINSYFTAFFVLLETYMKLFCIPEHYQTQFDADPSKSLEVAHHGHYLDTSIQEKLTQYSRSKGHQFLILNGEELANWIMETLLKKTLPLSERREILPFFHLQPLFTSNKTLHEPIESLFTQCLEKELAAPENLSQLSALGAQMLATMPATSIRKTSIIDIKKNYLQPMLTWCQGLGLLQQYDKKTGLNNSVPHLIQQFEKHQLFSTFICQELTSIWQRLQSTRWQQTPTKNTRHTDSLPSHGYKLKLREAWEIEINENEFNQWHTIHCFLQSLYQGFALRRKNDQPLHRLDPITIWFEHCLQNSSNLAFEILLPLLEQALEALVYTLSKQQASEPTYRSYYLRLTEPLREKMLTWIAQFETHPKRVENLLNELEDYPMSNGRRPVFLKKQAAWVETLFQVIPLNHLTKQTSDILQLFFFFKSPTAVEVSSYYLSQNTILSPKVAAILFDQDKLLRPSTLPGRHAVYAVEEAGHKIHIKIFPELPGIEYAVGQLHKLIINHGTPFTELLKIKIGQEIYTAQASQTIIGLPLHKVLKETPTQQANNNNTKSTSLRSITERELLEKLDHKSFSQLVLMTLLTNPEDGKPDNFIMEEFVNKAGKTRYRLVCVDNDHAFVSSLGKEGILGGYRIKLQVKTIVYCFDLMNQPLHPEAIEEFLMLVPDQVLLEWLMDLKTKEEAWQKIFTQPEIEAAFQRKNEEQKTLIPIWLKPGTVSQLYQKMHHIQRLLRQKPNMTHIELLLAIDHLLGEYYQPILTEQMSIAARFRQLTYREYKTLKDDSNQTMLNTIRSLQAMLGEIPDIKNKKQQEPYTLQKSLEELALIIHQQREKYLNQIQLALLSGDTDSFKKLALDEFKERIFNQIQWDLIKKPDGELDIALQTKILLAAQDTKFHTLKIKNCSALTIEILEKLIEPCKKHLVKIDIIACESLDDKAIRCIIDCERLEQLNLSALPKLEEITGRFGTSISFARIRKLVLRQNTNLTTCYINAPTLERISLQGCTELSKIYFDTKETRYFNFSNCSKIPLSSLNSLLGQNKNIQQLKLKGCTQIPDASFFGIPSLIYFDFSKISPDFKKIMLDVRNDNVTLLSLSQTNTNKKNSETIFLLINVIINDHSLTCLNLSNYFLSQANIKILANWLSKTQTLSNLTLNNCNIKTTGAKFILSALTENVSLISLGLSLNALDQINQIPLHFILGRKNKTLKFLTLSYNLLTSSDLNTLLIALKFNKSLVSLDLSNNFIDSNIIHKLSEILAINHTLQNLDLSWNRIDDNITHLIPFLNKKPGDFILSVNNNPLQIKTLTAIINTTQNDKNNKLKENQSEEKNNLLSSKTADSKILFNFMATPDLPNEKISTSKNTYLQILNDHPELAQHQTKAELQSLQIKFYYKIGTYYLDKKTYETALSWFLMCLQKHEDYFGATPKESSLRDDYLQMIDYTLACIEYPIIISLIHAKTAENKKAKNYKGIFKFYKDSAYPLLERLQIHGEIRYAKELQETIQKNLEYYYTSNPEKLHKHIRKNIYFFKYYQQLEWLTSILKNTTSYNNIYDYLADNAIAISSVYMSVLMFSLDPKEMTWVKLHDNYRSIIGNVNEQIKLDSFYANNIIHQWPDDIVGLLAKHFDKDTELKYILNCYNDAKEKCTAYLRRAYDDIKPMEFKFRNTKEEEEYIHQYGQILPKMYFTMIRQECLRPLVLLVMRKIGRPPCDFKLMLSNTNGYFYPDSNLEFIVQTDEDDDPQVKDLYFSSFFQLLTFYSRLISMPCIVKNDAIQIYFRGNNIKFSLPNTYWCSQKILANKLASLPLETFFPSLPYSSFILHLATLYALPHENITEKYSATLTVRSENFNPEQDYDLYEKKDLKTICQFLQIKTTFYLRNYLQLLSNCCINIAAIHKCDYLSDADDMAQNIPILIYQFQKKRLFTQNFCYQLIQLWETIGKQLWYSITTDFSNHPTYSANASANTWKLFIRPELIITLDEKSAKNWLAMKWLLIALYEGNNYSTSQASIDLLFTWFNKFVEYNLTLTEQEIHADFFEAIDAVFYLLAKYHETPKNYLNYYLLLPLRLRSLALQMITRYETSPVRLESILTQLNALQILPGTLKELEAFYELNNISQQEISTDWFKIYYETTKYRPEKAADTSIFPEKPGNYNSSKKESYAALSATVGHNTKSPLYASSHSVKIKYKSHSNEEPGSTQFAQYTLTILLTSAHKGLIDEVNRTITINFKSLIVAKQFQSALFEAGFPDYQIPDQPKIIESRFASNQNNNNASDAHTIQLTEDEYNAIMADDFAFEKLATGRFLLSRF